MKKTLIITIAFTFLLIQSVSAQNKVPKIPQSGICNGLATYLPKPEQPKPSAVNASGVVNVQVSIDEHGDVTSANAVSGHPLLRPLAEKAALKAKFRQTTFSGKPVKINCPVVYKFLPDESVQIKQTELPKGKPIVDLASGVLTGVATKLPKPIAPFCNCKFGNVKSISSVLVQAEIDEQGNISKANAISGHPLLKIASERAARKSKFMPSLIFGAPVKAKALILYKFLSVDKWSVKPLKVTVQNIEVENQ